MPQQNPFAAPQGAPPAPPMSPLPQEFRPHAQYLLSGNMLQQGNPFTQGLLNDQRRESERTYGGNRAQLSAATGGLGQFGSSQGNMLSGQLMGQHSQNLASQQNQTMFGVHEAERGRMMEAMNALGAFDTATADRGSAEMMHQAGLENQLKIAELQRQAQMAMSQGNLRAAQMAAESAQELQRNQLEFDRMGLGLSGLLGMGDQNLREMEILAALTGQSMQADQGMMGLAGAMSGQYGNQFLGAMGMVPGMEGAGYYGYGQALGAQQGLDEQQLRAAAAAYQANQAGRQQPMQDLAWLTSILGSVGGMGGSSSGFSAGNVQPYANPFAAAVQGGLGGALSGGQIDWGSLFGGGGGAFGGGGYGAGYGAGGGASGAATGGARAGAYRPSTGPGGGASSGGGVGASGFGAPMFSPRTWSSLQGNTVAGMAQYGQPGTYYLPSPGTTGGSEGQGGYWEQIFPWLQLGT